MKYLSLFSGIGGFELGIHQAYVSWNSYLQKTEKKNKKERSRPGHTKKELGELFNRIQSTKQPTCVGFSEIDPYAIKIYEKNFPEHTNLGDIEKVSPESLPDFDLLVAGFPCQAFSIIGKRQGFKDSRGKIFFAIIKILQAKQPRFFVLENVKGLLSHNNGKTFKTITTSLAHLGYDLQWQVLNSKNFNVPQNRERIFIIGHLRETHRPEVFPISKGSQTPHVLPTLTARYWGSQTIGGYINYKERGLVPYLKLRRLTPIECERLQGFPDNWTSGISDTQRYKCLGNAVTVPVIKEIITLIISSLQ